MGNVTDPPLTRGNDLSKTDESLAVVVRMDQALQAASNDMAAHFHEDFRWIANYGCGSKHGVDAFRRNWQLPLRAAFSQREYYEEARIAQGEWVAAFGYIEATHSGEFMGIAATGKQVRINYTDFWKVRDGRIAENYVTVDFPGVLAQLGRDVFDGQGWEAYDEGLRNPPSPLDTEVSQGPRGASRD